MTGVGTQKVFENDRVIVWHLDLEPGEQGGRHTHKLDYVVRILSGSTLEVFGPDGALLDTIELGIQWLLLAERTAIRIAGVDRLKLFCRASNSGCAEILAR